MHDIWNPWHGCTKKSEGCQHCYMFYLDKIHDNKVDSSVVYKTNNFNYPLQRDRSGEYKVKSGEQLRICMTSDFFVEEADVWRNEAWDIIRRRKDISFFILTKRPERVLDNLPSDWEDGYENVLFNVTCENQKRADERIPILLDLPFKHKGIMCAPFIGEVKIDKYLDTGKIEQVIVGGENYDGARPCNFDWVKSLYEACKSRDITFCFMETGSVFIKDGKKYNIPSKDIQSKMAFKSGMNYKGKDIEFKLYDEFLNELNRDELYRPYFSEKCMECGSRIICNGCSKCGKCK
ncbi:MAG: phage Gp37/Gp68 family protein [Bacilli bacterium]|nr:phage Gp37/Gp68 family protein [Bacilli bacterium]